MSLLNNYSDDFEVKNFLPVIQLQKKFFSDISEEISQWKRDSKPNFIKFLNKDGAESALNEYYRVTFAAKSLISEIETGLRAFLEKDTKNVTDAFRGVLSCLPADLKEIDKEINSSAINLKNASLGFLFESSKGGLCRNEKGEYSQIEGERVNIMGISYGKVKVEQVFTHGGYEGSDGYYSNVAHNLPPEAVKDPNCEVFSDLSNFLEKHKKGLQEFVETAKAKNL